MLYMYVFSTGSVYAAGWQRQTTESVNEEEEG